MRIGTAEQDSTFLTQGLALRTILERKGIAGPIEILASQSASIDNANRLHEGKLDFGFMAANWIGRAKRGLAPFTAPVDLRMAAPMNAGPLYFITLPGSGLSSVADLRGRRVAVGARTSGMAQHARSMFDALGWRAQDFETYYLDFAAGAQAVASGAVDAQLQCPLPNKVMSDLTAHTPVKVLPWPADHLERLITTVPFYRRTTMRAGMLPGIEGDIAQPAVLNVLVTHARVDESLVRDVVRAVAMGANELEKLNPLFAGMNELFEPLRTEGPAAFEIDGVPLHPGALTGYREAGMLR
jgi:hypothetical protein